MKKYSKKELREASEHIAYEMKILFAIELELGKSNEEGVNHNALLESFAVHSRILIHFFWSEKPRKDDMVATQFVKNVEEWKKIRPKKTELLEEVEFKAKKQVAYLTFKRLDYDFENKGWYYEANHNELYMCSILFLKNIDTDLIGQSLKEMMSSANKSSVFSNLLGNQLFDNIDSSE